MKKNIKNVFKTGIIIIIFLAFVMPGVTSTEKKLSEETLNFADATFDWIPVNASGIHNIVGNEIILYETGQTVTLEIYVSGWYPNLLSTVQATVDSSQYSNGVGGTLIPLGWPGTPEDGCFINISRSDFVFNGMVFLEAVSTGALDYMWGATLLTGGKADDSQTYYLGTLILEIPTNADGLYFIDFIDGTTKTFMKDDVGQFILPIITTPAVIKINHPPDKPATPSGTTNGKVGTSYPYTTSCNDPNGDFVHFWFDWGDGTNSGWVGPFASGAPGSASHTWASQGSYNIQVKAKDSNGVESVWSDPLSVAMPRSKAINTTFLNFLQSHPNMFPLLQRLLQRLELQ
jgi:hypothetical protein